MARLAETALSDWTYVELKDRSGVTFYTLEDLRFEVEFCDGMPAQVSAIETESTVMLNGRTVKRAARLTDADPLFGVIVAALDIGTLEFERHNADLVGIAEDERYEALRDAVERYEAL